ncbi:hypothetical protein MK163_18230, partial [bacterium]|nr:hypothetical protein [bacterium]
MPDVIVRPGKGHGWPEMPDEDWPHLVEWFDEHLLNKCNKPQSCTGCGHLRARALRARPSVHLRRRLGLPDVRDDAERWSVAAPRYWR